MKIFKITALIFIIISLIACASEKAEEEAVTEPAPATDAKPVKMITIEGREFPAEPVNPNVQRYFKPVIPSWEDMAKVELVQELANDQLSFLEEIKDDNNYDIIYSLGQVAGSIRHKVESQFDEEIHSRLYSALMGGGHWAWSDGLDYQPELVQWREGYMNVAREWLSNPDRLWATYKIFKSIAVNFIDLHPQKDKQRAYIQDVLIPIFMKPMTAPVIRALAEYRYAREVLNANYKKERFAAQLCPSSWCSCSNNCEDYSCEIYDKENCDDIAYEQLIKADADSRAAFRVYDRAEEKFKKMVPNWLELEWMLRRRSEGGKEIVRTWGRIFQDLYDSTD